MSKAIILLTYLLIFVNHGADMEKKYRVEMTEEKKRPMYIT